MAVVFQDYTGNGSRVDYPVTFNFLQPSDVKVSVAGVTQTVNTHYTVTDTTLTFASTAIPVNNSAIRIFRNTNIDQPTHTFQGGSSIKFDYLNDNQKQVLYKLAEIGLVTASDEGLGLTSGDKNDIHVTSANDWYIRSNTVEESMLADNSVDSRAFVDGGIDAIHLAGDIVDGSKIADNSINSEHYVDGSIDRVHLEADIIDGSKLADNIVGIEHIRTNSVDSDELVDGSVDLSHLSASGTKNNTTYLRGDNTWEQINLGNIEGTKVTIGSTGSWTIPTGVKTARVYCIGGGGGSGGAHSNFDDSARRGKAGGGGSGATSYITYTTAELGSSAATITIGTGGTAGVWGSGTAAGTGGTTSFNPSGTGATLEAGGGAGSLHAGEFESNGAGGAGGTAASGYQKVWYGNQGNSGSTVSDSVGANGDPMTISNAPLGDGYTYGRGAEPHHGGDGNDEGGNAGYAGGVVIFYDT